MNFKLLLRGVKSDSVSLAAVVSDEKVGGRVVDTVRRIARAIPGEWLERLNERPFNQRELWLTGAWL